jgi:2-polyprenyl-3-methyl-5-hydroxy-6-metoxy-1,4-benzoquinol methylase
MTTPTSRSRDAAYFENLYAANPDPWNFTSSAYEHQKYLATLAALAGRHFTTAFEVGCSIGVLTHRLAPQCQSLLAVDIVEAALTAARLRCAELPHVTFANLKVPDLWPENQTFDLILLSEILYFLSAADIARVAHLVAATLSQTGTVLLVNYTGKTDELNSGDEAAKIFIAATRPTLHPNLEQHHEKFRIDRLEPVKQTHDRGR